MTRRPVWTFASLAAASLAACAFDETPRGEDPSPDAEMAIALDAGTVLDAGALDTGTTVEADAGFAEDAAAGDATPADAAAPDATPAPDAAGRDAAAPDALPPPDAGDPAPAVLNPGWIGGPCTSDADCMYTGGTCLTNAAGWPGGTCTQACTQFCPDQTGPLNSVTFCVDGGASGTCLSRCDYTLSPTGCRSGYVCLPEKRYNQPSVVRYSCVPSPNGVPGRPVPAFDIGEACTSASDCNRATCITDLPGGYCTQEACDVTGCPAGSTCFGLGLEGFNVCLRDCAVPGECRQNEGYTCDSDNTCWYVPPPAGVCNLTNAAADCAAYAAQSSQTFAVVTKHLRRLAHCSGSTLLGAYCVGLGSNPVDDKEREGDRRTPEGIFYIPRKLPNSQYYKAFLISYPDIDDADRGLAAGLITQSEYNAIVAAQNARTEPPQFTALGGLIEIHGGGAGADWTWGCMAADNTAIDTLWPSLDVGDTVVILH